MQVYVDGAFVPAEEARISVFDHGFLYGDGVFEGIRVYDGNIFRLPQHLQRLYDSAQCLLLRIPLPQDELRDAIVETVTRRGLPNQYVRVVVSRGAGDLGLNPRLCPQPSIIIIADTIALYPSHFYTEGLELVTVATRRTPTWALDPRIKSLNYLNNILAKIEAQQAGVLEAVMLNSEGYLAECTADNLFFVRHGQLYTPSTAAGALQGITRDGVLDIAQALGVPTAEGLFTRYDLYTADECFMTGTGAEIVPVVRIDGRTIGTGQPGPLTARLRQGFEHLCRHDGVQIATYTPDGALA
ncbi:MAG: branched-chain-amino-acid transaminase [Candidatus Tectomicrobia bacterium]|uniref:Branched-chain-amino-acid aminotransferase n=1 Tax=Tectimicrobiota bacterium TaxID=2528274 RepID=A0A938B3H1_UNCTE|nr:branched-chain-amino-acid transaminase [Candidatus Tectomicrobia bacterium]